NCGRGPAQGSIHCCRHWRGTTPSPHAGRRRACDRGCAGPSRSAHCRGRRRRWSADSSFPLLVIRVLARTAIKLAGNAPQIKILPQPVHRIAYVAFGEMIELIAEERDRWWPGLHLRCISDLDAATRGGGRRIALECFFEPAIKLARWNPHAPSFDHCED